MICPQCGKETDAVVSATVTVAGAAQPNIIHFCANANAGAQPINLYSPVWTTANVPLNVCSGACNPMPYVTHVIKF